MSEVLVEVKRKVSGLPLGISFKELPSPPHCQIASITEEGVLGKINEGDILIGINGMSVRNFNPAEVKDILNRYASATTLRLEVRRAVMNGNAAPLINLPNAGGVDDADSHSSSEGISPLPLRRMRRAPIVAANLAQLPPSDPSELQPPGSHRLSLTPESKRKKIIPLKKTQTLDWSNLPQWRQTAQVVPLQDLLKGTELQDRLHTQRKITKDTGCTQSQCLGSHMWPKAHRQRPFATPRTKDDVYPLAEDFIKQYYESRKQAFGNNYEEKLQQRQLHVKEEIDQKGQYELTYEELVFGARTAWRNAPRCVNRIVWKQLEVLDARDASTPKEMFEAIIHHIKYANNGGNIRSTITVFKQRTKVKQDFRVWSIQLISYAGYSKNDGSVLGDPARVEFTNVCLKLGWVPPKKKTAFDVLPLVIQAGGGEPQLFTIPPEIILEVEIHHPEYDWFKDLGLRWYALPAVANMMLDVGGVEFPGIPFNGWYMGTEIARDLGDVNRYNMLKPIANGLGLNTQSYKMWKDRAMLELNVSILHSFQKANVSIVDHHSATESFMGHMKSETQLRGGCPADWVWIVPPISGSLTPVFHQEMLLYHLSPSYEYQDDPWKHHNFDGPMERRERSHSFKSVAQMVAKTTLLFRTTVLQKRVKATILYATETGRSRNYSNVMKDLLGRVFAVKVVCMEDYDRANLEHEQLLLVVTSTFGSGDPPSNGESFGRYMLDLRNGTVVPGGKLAPTPTPRSHRMSTIVAPSRQMLEDVKGRGTEMTQVKYAVFGLGSRAYPNFCTFAHTCDNLLKDMGAEQIFPCGEGDELYGQEESFQTWLQQCYLRACEIYSLDPRMEEADWEGYKTGYDRDNYRVQAYEKSIPKRQMASGLKLVHKKEVVAVTLKCRTKLQTPLSDRSTILLVLNTSKTRIRYEPGDHIAIYPQNHTKLVNELMERLNPSVGFDEPIYIQSRRTSQSEIHWMDERRMPVPVTLREALIRYLDITNPPTPQFLKLLAKQATRAIDQEELNELAKGGQLYEDWKYFRFPNLLDVLSQFHSLKVDITLLLQQLPLLQCRYYSISSSPKMHPNEVHATVSIVSFRKRNGTGPKHLGVCSTWLNRIEVGTDVPCFIRKAHAFHMPEDVRAPVIMVGPGTGIAPFRSFWEDRIHRRNEALRLQLSQPSHIAVPSQPTIKHQASEPGPKRRRQTTFVPPNPRLLETPRKSIDHQQQQQSGVGVSEEDFIDGAPPLHMRRSVSDADNTDDIAKMLAAKQKSLGNMSLYFGCRRSDMDHIYRDEMKKAQVLGALTDVHVALSREPERPKQYVQHLLKENAETVVRQLIEDRGHIYVCGDISMAADVCRTLQSIFEENAAMSSEEARKLIESMKDKGLYHEDIFGVTLKHQEVTQRVRTAARKAWRVLVSAADTNQAGSPLTPLRSPMRPPSPMPGQRLGSKPQTPVDSPTLSLPRQSKRPTVTVLIPSMATPAEAKITRPSAPNFPPSFHLASPSKLRRYQGTANTLDESQVAPLQAATAAPAPLIGSTGLSLMDDVTPMSILDPVSESPECRSPPPVINLPNSNFTGGPECPTIRVKSPDSDSPEQKESPPPPQPQSVTQQTAEVKDTSSASLPVVVGVKAEGGGGEGGEGGEGGAAAAAVVKRNMAPEKKKARRIRTNSSIETVV